MMRYRITALLVLIAWISLSSATIPAMPPKDLLAAGRVDEAVLALNGHLKSSPDDAEAYHLLCRAYFAMKQWNNAIAAGERSIALQPNNSSYHMWLGRAYGEKADASSFITAADLASKVRREFERAVQLNPANFDARTDLAEYYVEAPGFLGGGKDKAQLQAEYMSKTDLPTAHWIRAKVAEKDKKYDVAERELRASIEAAPGNQAQFWLNLASFYRRRARWPEMEDAINKAITADNKKPRYMFDAAEILLRAGRNFPLAAQLLRTYISSNAPAEDAPIFEAHYLLGTLLEKQGNKKGAADEYRISVNMAKGFERAQSALKRVGGS